MGQSGTGNLLRSERHNRRLYAERVRQRTPQRLSGRPRSLGHSRVKSELGTRPGGNMDVRAPPITGPERISIWPHGSMHKTSRWDWSLARFLDAWHGRGVARGRRDRHHGKYSGYRRLGGRSGTNKCGVDHSWAEHGAKRTFQLVTSTDTS